ncbi:MAG TPA: pyridoxamine 5'-phosphate oxidase family protein [Candidatus Saccharimonadales bacterium]|nr:pyridoxamine 5'-phosphate oxidase family protein [Candidatus Saccharimonadales bacterium]
MDPKKLAKEYLENIKIMQLATAENNKPWVCTVHFYADNELNLWWSSRTDRKHSQQLAGNSQASATVLVHENTSEEDYVIAITATGKAELMKGISKEVKQAYITKLDRPAYLTPPNNMQEFYRLKPESIVVFDTKNFPKDPRQEFKL